MHTARSKLFGEYFHDLLPSLVKETNLIISLTGSIRWMAVIHENRKERELVALTKELVELHKGKIAVESETGKGTTFIVKLPLGKDHLKPEEIVEDKVKEEIKYKIDEKELMVETNQRKEKTDIDVLLDTDKPLLLVVEDNSDVRKYIISHLEDNYRIQEAVDGEDGVNQAFNHIPDLIISDVMMPKMDGFEMCSKLKTDERTSHIPIIMLTAKATSQDKIPRPDGAR